MMCIELDPETLAIVMEGLKQAQDGLGKPLDFDLEDDDTWLED